MKLSIKRALVSTAITAAFAAPMAANATNGMNLEGYGPIATGMGGASMAYDNGTAAVMNNPATLGLMEDGDGRFDAALGMLGPDVTATVASAADSDGTMYWMPALGYAVREGNLTYGIGVFSQGGMGTDYDTDTWPAQPPVAGGGGAPATNAVSGSVQEVRSVVGVGRLILPVAFNVNDQLTIAGSADLVWAGMDMRMTMGCADMSGMVTADTYGFGCADPFDAVQLDFSDDSRFTGAAKGYGLAGKLGIHYQANDVLAVGATFHSKTYMSDLDAGVNLITTVDSWTQVISP
ncbi:OmpP1/FadL family transporter [Candidatus Reidiella endopervernicosa]|uniref:Outer membrane protein transport protein n=1 Tax=Candidatus Reidiella endopervernicosa TaxID=2738883 RepID=A0A6N0HYM9_9GAMM|nr:outer membrane protein transport protein [Candidatus Reidiella endopervernicosa]QKQ27455.1 outer membrane protein transport protein [Candidatus Reidiella endopervernicosa]